VVSWGKGVLGRKEVVQECFVGGDRVGSTLEGGDSRSLSGGNELFGRPDILSGCFGVKIGPVGEFGSFDDLEVSHLALFGDEKGVMGLEFLAL